MVDTIDFIKLKPPMAAEPNTARPWVKLLGANAILSYRADAIDRDTTADILFDTVAMMRVGGPNDEGFFGAGKPGIINDSLYNWKRFPRLEWGEFYEVIGFDWTKGLVGTCYEEEFFEGSIAVGGTGPIVLIPAATPTDGFRHFVFFMKDGTFECVCKGWEGLSLNRTSTPSPSSPRKRN